MIEKVVYILGAGFSAPLGLPVMSNFLEKSKDIYFGSTSPERDYPHFTKVFNTITTMHIAKSFFKADLSNIEEILSILEMSTAFSTGQSTKFFKKYIIDVINYFTPMIEENSNLKIHDWYERIFGYNELDNHYGCFVLSLFSTLFGRDLTRDHGENIYIFPFELFHESKAMYSIVTLNYDMVLENFCKYINENFNFDDHIKFINSNEENTHPYQPYLIKLHGSVDSVKIIPPTWNKVLKDKIIKNAWKTAYLKLKEANYIRFIGYSLPTTDSYIKYLLKSSIIHSKHLKKLDVICLDNQDNSVKKRFEEFIDFHNYRFASANVIDYLKINFNNRIKIKSTNNQNERTILYNNLEASHENFMENNAI